MSADIAEGFAIIKLRNLLGDSFSVHGPYIYAKTTNVDRDSSKIIRVLPTMRREREKRSKRTVGTGHVNPQQLPSSTFYRSAFAGSRI